MRHQNPQYQTVSTVCSFTYILEPPITLPSKKLHRMMSAIPKTRYLTYTNTGNENRSVKGEKIEPTGWRWRAWRPTECFSAGMMATLFYHVIPLALACGAYGTHFRVTTKGTTAVVLAILPKLGRFLRISGLPRSDRQLCVYV